MKNDYKRNDFREVKIDGEKRYYIRVNKMWINVEKEVFYICKSSYLKILRDGNRNDEKLFNYENIDQAYPYQIYEEQVDIISQIYLKDLNVQLHNAMLRLSKNEYYIIKSLYFDGLTERDVAISLNTSHQVIHYQKKKILKKLKNFLPK